MALLLTTTATEHHISTYDWPRCGKCHMPVQEFSVFDTIDTGITLMAACHGDREVVNVPDEVLVSMIGSRMGFGTAFKENEDD